ncbi:hypothetical protein BHM03_00015907 [Ensete ventricosum]|nr:hypothetical protein BHM03_00015907 [Ensete ventricosum]
MTRLQMSPSAETYDAIISGLNRKGCFQKSYMVLHEMMEKRVRVKRTHYIALINGKCRVGDTRGAFKLRDEMEALGLVPAEVAESSINFSDRCVKAMLPGLKDVEQVCNI